MCPRGRPQGQGRPPKLHLWLPHPGKILDLFCCPGKSLNFVYRSWKKFLQFSRDLPE